MATEREAEMAGAPVSPPGNTVAADRYDDTHL